MHMMFKKSGGKIFGVVFTPKEQKAIDAEVSRQLIARHMEFADDVDYMILKILHDHFGFGPSRLRRFYERFMEENNALMVCTVANVIPCPMLTLPSVIVPKRDLSMYCSARCLL